MTREDRFVQIVRLVESNNKPEAWGDDGMACGAFQWHPSAFIAWYPQAHEFGNRERTWDWAFEMALRKFHRAALKDWPEATDLDVCMAYHLHGYVRWTGHDDHYAARFVEMEARVPA